MSRAQVYKAVRLFMLLNVVVIIVVPPRLWHQKPVRGVGQYAHAKTHNNYSLSESELLPSWQRLQLDLNLPKLGGCHRLYFTFRIVSHSSISSWYFRIFYAIFRYCCCHLGLLRLPFSAPCQPPQGLVGWPTAAWRSGTWSPQGCLLYCFQPIFCGSHGVAHVQRGMGGGVKGLHIPLHWRKLPLLNHDQFITKG